MADADDGRYAAEPIRDFFEQVFFSRVLQEKACRLQVHYAHAAALPLEVCNLIYQDVLRANDPSGIPPAGWRPVSLEAKMVAAAHSAP